MGRGAGVPRPTQRRPVPPGAGWRLSLRKVRISGWPSISTALVRLSRTGPLPGVFSRTALITMRGLYRCLVSSAITGVPRTPAALTAALGEMRTCAGRCRMPVLGLWGSGSRSPGITPVVTGGGGSDMWGLSGGHRGALKKSVVVHDMLGRHSCGLVQELPADFARSTGPGTGHRRLPMAPGRSRRAGRYPGVQGAVTRSAWRNTR
jgi:hypothetical protein